MKPKSPSPAIPRIPLDAEAIDALYGLEPAFEPGAESSSDLTRFVSVQCPYCGESFETAVDWSAGRSGTSRTAMCAASRSTRGRRRRRWRAARGDGDSVVATPPKAGLTPSSFAQSISKPAELTGRAHSTPAAEPRNARAERLARALGLGAGSHLPGRLPTATVSPSSARPSTLCGGGPPAGAKTCGPVPPGPRAVGGQQAPTLGAQFLCTPGSGGTAVPDLRTLVADGEDASRTRHRRCFMMPRLDSACAHATQAQCHRGSRPSTARGATKAARPAAARRRSQQ